MRYYLKSHVFLLTRLRKSVLPYNLEVAVLQGDVYMRINFLLFPHLGDKIV